MGVVNRPNTYTSNTTISPSEVNDDFDTLYNEFNGSISAANLATDAVTTAKITDSNVTTAKIADSNVTTAKIASSAVTLAKIADTTITADKLNLVSSANTASVATDQTTTSGSYTDLATTTDTVTVTIGVNGNALVLIQAAMWASAAGVGINASVALSGANTVTAGTGSTPLATKNTNGTTSNDLQIITSHSLMTGLTPGSTTFKMKYLVGGGVTGHYSLRKITVIPM